MDQRSTRIALATLISSVLCAGIGPLGGCGGNDVVDQVAAKNDSNIRRVANLYMAYQFRKGMKGPGDEAQFKNFITKEMAPRKLEMMQVDRNNVEALFRSERDDQPFHVRYGMAGGPGSKLAVVFEQQGKDGKRLVAFTNGAVEEADDARYQQLLKDSGKAS